MRGYSVLCLLDGLFLLVMIWGEGLKVRIPIRERGGHVPYIIPVLC